GALHFADAQAVGAVPALATEPLRSAVLDVLAPGADRVEARPVRDGDAEPRRGARALDAEIAGLLAREVVHRLPHRGVALVVVGRALRREDDGEVRWVGRPGERHGYVSGTRTSLPVLLHDFGMFDEPR